VSKSLARALQRIGDVSAKTKITDTRIGLILKMTQAVAVVAAFAMTVSKGTRALALIAAFAIASVTPAFAQAGAASPSTPSGIIGAPVAGAPAAGVSVPSSIGATRTTDTPYESPAGDGAAPATLSHTNSHRHTTVHRRKHASTADSGVVESAQGHLKLLQDSFAYKRPSKSSTRIQPVQADKFVNVIGTTRHYAQVRLKDEQIAYIPLTAIDLVKPTDKRFTLTADSAVLSAPNHSASRVAEVHRGRDVHVVGIAINYAKIRMKNGTEGFIPIHVLE